MKKTLLITSLIILTAKLTFAQDIAVGIKAGVNINSASTSIPVVESGKETLALFHGGAVVDVAVNQRFSIQPQILYSRKGVKFNAGDHKHTIKLNSLDLPLLAVFKAGKGVFFGAGPNFGFHLSGTNVSTGALNETHKYKFDGSTGDFKRFDFGVNVMAGYEHKSGVFTSVNYLKGISKGLIEFPNTDWSHNVLSFSVGYMFRRK
jgi:hypothetical protein